MSRDDGVIENEKDEEKPTKLNRTTNYYLYIATEIIILTGRTIYFEHTRHGRIRERIFTLEIRAPRYERVHVKYR